MIKVCKFYTDTTQKWITSLLFLLEKIHVKDGEAKEDKSVEWSADLTVLKTTF